jgi:hypothetical protein
MANQLPSGLNSWRRSPVTADRVRYDMAFQYPGDPSIVAFPLFAHKEGGRYPDKVTHGMWDSSTRFETFADATRTWTSKPEEEMPVGITPFGIVNLNDWTTYVTEPPQYRRELVTYAEFMKRNPKLKQVGWRRV